MSSKFQICLAICLYVFTGACFGLGGDFQLNAHDGSRYSLQDSRGRVVVLAFGYTFCPDVCPTALATIGSAMNALGDDAGEVDALFISLDPDRDTPEHLAQYAPFFHPSLLGLTGTADELERIAQRYQVRYSFVGKGERENYSLDHSASIYLIDHEGRLIRMVPHGLPAEVLTNNLRFAVSVAKQRRENLQRWNQLDAGQRP